MKIELRNKIVCLPTFFILHFSIFLSCLTINEVCASDFKVRDAEKQYISNYLHTDDVVLGKKDAKVTIVEYSSFSCGHCMKFHEKILPQIKNEYVDTGKVNFVHRDFPLDIKSLYGSVALRCIDQKHYYEALNALFIGSHKWIYANSGSDFLRNLTMQLIPYGITDEEQMKKCLTNKTIGQKILDGRKIAISQANVNSTPTIFVNDFKIVGLKDIDELRQVINQQLIKYESPH